MRKIISISIDEGTLKHIDEARGLATRSKFIEAIIMVAEYKCWSIWSSPEWKKLPENAWERQEDKPEEPEEPETKI